ncbi:MAG: hypothetical protein V1740_03565 [Candidatus Woesearchaeota archaeon]
MLKISNIWKKNNRTDQIFRRNKWKNKFYLILSVFIVLFIAYYLISIGVEKASVTSYAVLDVDGQLDSGVQEQIELEYSQDDANQFIIDTIVPISNQCAVDIIRAEEEIEGTSKSLDKTRIDLEILEDEFQKMIDEYNIKIENEKNKVYRKEKELESSNERLEEVEKVCY